MVARIKLEMRLLESSGYWLMTASKRDVAELKDGRLGLNRRRHRLASGEGEAALQFTEESYPRVLFWFVLSIYCTSA